VSEATGGTEEDGDVEALLHRFHAVRDSVRAEMARVVVGQRECVDLLLVTLLVGGHSLITGLPGTAKTLMVKSLARALGLDFRRIQFTPDLMPGDVTGTDVVEQDPATGRREFRFVRGPLFCNVLLADEINRTPPKTQSALLEAMQERSVTVRGVTHALPPPFMVLATQNPIELEGTYPLPEAQLDRFVFNIALDYLDAGDEAAVVALNLRGATLPEPAVVTDAAEVCRFQWLARQVVVREDMMRYAVALARATRPGSGTAPPLVDRFVRYGASVRAAIFIAAAARARALLAGRHHVTAADISSVVHPVLRHRVFPNYLAEAEGIGIDRVLAEVVDQVRAEQ
jgi:MoxR-like ATPase